MAGTLYLVPTPIGNLEDITLRAVEVLRQVDIVAAEDTRHTGILLHHFELHKPLISYQEHNEQQRIPEIIAKLENGVNIALVSDAGTPAISDPGYKLVRSAIDSGIPVDALPGPSSTIVALVGSGLPSDKFYFAGFPAKTSAKRQKQFEDLANLPATLIFFESPHRLAQTIADAYAVFNNRQAVVARELTKMHQEYKRGLLAELVDFYKQKNIKGEIVLLIEGLTRQNKSSDNANG
jgi:16S rRNA (cytidine1402-2'-O)-methyltransferase